MKRAFDGTALQIENSAVRDRPCKIYPYRTQFRPTFPETCSGDSPKELMKSET